MSSLEYALQKCREMPYHRNQSRHYAVIVDKRNRIVAEAGNDYRKTHPLMSKTSKKLGLFKEYCHAEQLCIVRARGKGVKMYVVRVDSSGKACYSAPCPVCAVLIAESDLKSVEFSC